MEKYKLNKIIKRYPGVLALKEVDFDVRAGEVHGLVGKNGAGKSTLVNIMYGRIPYDEGEVYIKGKLVNRISPQISNEMGVALVPQEPQVINNLSIAENLFISNLIPNSNIINWGKISKSSKDVLKKIEMDIDPNIPIGELSIGQQQLISIAKAFFVDNADIILLDEVTASLSKKDTETLFNIIYKKKFEDASACIIFISHILEEVMQICDRVTVIRNGLKVACRDIENLSKNELIHLIMGKKETLNSKHTRERKAKESIKKKKEVLLSIRNLSRIKEFNDISFDLKKGEIIGLAGLTGAGKTELLKCIVGVTNPDNGEIHIEGHKHTINPSIKVLQNKIGFLTEEKEKEGLIPQMSVKHNISISVIHKILNSLGFIKNKEEIKLAKEMVNRLQILTNSIDQEIGFLSGGNKQKVIIARLMAVIPNIYILDEPTKGVDVEAKGEILKIICGEIKKNSGIIITTPSIEELIMVSDRIIVLYRGRITSIFNCDDFDEVKIFKAIQGVNL